MVNPMSISNHKLGSWRELSDHYLRALENPWYHLIANLQHHIHSLTQSFFEEQQIKTMHFPITTGSISSPMGLGSDSLPVEVNLYGVKTYLADSMQFMLEYGCRIFDKGCYYIMPSFRGEDADERHLCQFYHSEAEIPGTLADVINLVNKYIHYLSVGIMNNYAGDIAGFAGNIDHIEKIVSLKTIPQIKFEEAVKFLDAYAKKNNLCASALYKTLAPHMRTLTSYGEKILIEAYQGMVWVTHFDHGSVPFYQAYDADNHHQSLSADLLFGIGEVVGSGERHIHSTSLRQAISAHEVQAPEMYDWYIQLKEKHPIQTAGFGMGVERYLLWLLKHNDIRDCQLIPRFNGIDILP